LQQIQQRFRTIGTNQKFQLSVSAILPQPKAVL
jgi:hypothetical protein